MKTAWNIIKGLFLGLLFSGVVFMIFLGLIWLLFLPMTKEGEEQQKRHESFCRQVNQEAISYIEEKYGFTPEITETIQENQRQIFGYQYFDRGIAYMTYDNRDFHVCYDGDADICYDDYQYEEIYAALEEMFRANGAGYEKMIVDAWGDVRVSIDNEFEDASQNLFHTYYDGTNLEEMLTERGFTAAGCYTAGEDFSQKTDWQIPEAFLQPQDKPIKLVFISCRAEQIPEVEESEELLTHKAAPYVHSYCLIGNSCETVQDRFVLHQFEDVFSYCVTDDAEITLTPTETDADYWWAESTYHQRVPVGQAYRIEADSDCTLYLYYDPEAAAEKYGLKYPLWIGCRLRPDIMPPSKGLFDIADREFVPEYIVVTIDLTAGEPKVIVPLSDSNLHSEESDT